MKTENPYLILYQLPSVIGRFSHVFTSYWMQEKFAKIYMS
jgi:hypothetical protein